MWNDLAIWLTIGLSALALALVWLIYHMGALVGQYEELTKRHEDTRAALKSVRYDLDSYKSMYQAAASQLELVRQPPLELELGPTKQEN